MSVCFAAAAASPSSFAERDAEVAGVGEPARAVLDQRGAFGAGDQRRDRVREHAAVAEQWHEAVDRLGEIRIVLARGLEQVLRAVPVLELGELRGADHDPRTRLGIDNRVRGALEHGQCLVFGHADLDRELGERFEHVGAIRIEPIGLAVGVERAARIAELARVELSDLAVQLRAVFVALDVDRVAAEQVDQHRPLPGAAIEHFERLVGVRVVGLDQEHALEAIGRVVAAADVLPGIGHRGQPAHRLIVVDVDQAGHLIERQLGPAIGDRGEPEQRIEVVGERLLAERRQPHHDRAVGVLALLQVVGELAQDLGALVRFLGRLRTLEVHVDDLVPLGVERRVRDSRRGALDRGAQPLLVELRELLEEGPDDEVDGPDARGVAPHWARAYLERG